MDKNLLPIQQRTLEFAQDQRWQQLAESVRHECQQHLSQLLKQVVASERNDHEREDQ